MYENTKQRHIDRKHLTLRERTIQSIYLLSKQTDEFDMFKG